MDFNGYYLLVANGNKCCRPRPRASRRSVSTVWFNRNRKLHYVIDFIKALINLFIDAKAIRKWFWSLRDRKMGNGNGLTIEWERQIVYSAFMNVPYEYRGGGEHSGMRMCVLQTIIGISLEMAGKGIDGHRPDYTAWRMKKNSIVCLCVWVCAGCDALPLQSAGLWKTFHRSPLFSSPLLLLLLWPGAKRFILYEPWIKSFFIVLWTFRKSLRRSMPASSPPPFGRLVVHWLLGVFPFDTFRCLCTLKRILFF